MTVAAALQILRNVGTVTVSHGSIKLRFPAKKRADLRPAIDILRNRKAEALALLNAEPSPQSAVIVPKGGRLKNHAVELWRKGERYFIVADEEDALLAKSRLRASAGEIWTAQEVEIVAQIEDKASREEIQRFKRAFNGRVREIRKTDRRGAR